MTKKPKPERKPDIDSPQDGNDWIAALVAFLVVFALMLIALWVIGWGFGA